MNWFEKILVKETPLKKDMFFGHEVRFISRDVMMTNASFGYNYNGVIYVSAALSPRVERFVISHERYHIKDPYNWLGWIGSELRSNIVCGIHDPIGLFATIVTSMRKDRLVAYWHAIKHVNFKRQ